MSERKYKYVSAEVVNKRSNWAVALDEDYYYLRGKLDALKSIAEYVLSGAYGSSRYLAYDVLNVGYADSLDHKGLDLNNWFYNNEKSLKERDSLRKVYEAAKAGVANHLPWELTHLRAAIDEHEKEFGGG